MLNTAQTRLDHALQSHAPLLIGVIHLPALPGAPGHNSADTPSALLEYAQSEAKAYAEAGFGAVIVENLGDFPYPKQASEPHVAALLALAARTVKQTLPGLAVGINILRNDCLTALGVAAMAEADFIRVNVLSGAYATDQGVIESPAFDLLRYRERLGASEIGIAADVHVKYATPLFDAPLGDAAKTAITRGGADAVVISGVATGAPTSPDDLRAVRRGIGPSGRILVGSGVGLANAETLRELADGFIVGTDCKYDREVHAPVDPQRARSLARLLTRTSD